MIVRIATRRSSLAMWQAKAVAKALVAADPSIEPRMVGVETKVDKDLTIPISSFAGKGAFCKEVQNLVLAGEADIAVHSSKDMQAVEVPGLSIAGYIERGDARDCLIGSTLDGLAKGATIATGSARRRAQLLERRPDLNFVELRGNIDTRLMKLDEVDAIVMAYCALTRLGREPEVVDVLPLEDFVPQVGQAAIAVETRSDDVSTLELCAMINHRETQLAVDAERAFLTALDGNCDLPGGAHATIDGDQISILGFLSDGESKLAHSEAAGSTADDVGNTLAKALVADLD